jgi:hypothetical protein
MFTVGDWASLQLLTRTFPTAWVIQSKPNHKPQIISHQSKVAEV